MENSMARPKPYPHIPLLPLAGLLSELDDSSAPPCRRRLSRPAPRRDILAISPSTSPVSSSRDVPQSSSSSSISLALVPTQPSNVTTHVTTTISIASPSSNLDCPSSLAHTDVRMDSRPSLRTCARARGRVSTNVCCAPPASAPISVLAWTTTPRASSSPTSSTSPTLPASLCTMPPLYTHTDVPLSTHVLADASDPVLVSPQPHTPTVSTPIASPSPAMAHPLAIFAPAYPTSRADVATASAARGDTRTPPRSPRAHDPPLAPTTSSPTPASVAFSQPRPCVPCPPRRPASAAQLGRLAVARASQASAARVRAPISAAPAIAAARTAMLRTRRAAEAPTTTLDTTAKVSVETLKELKAADTLRTTTQKPCLQRPLTANLRRARLPPNAMGVFAGEKRESVAAAHAEAESAPPDAHGPRIYAPIPLHQRTQRRRTPLRVPRPFTFDMHTRAAALHPSPHASPSDAPAVWLHVGPPHAPDTAHAAHSSPQEHPPARRASELERALSRARARMCKTQLPHQPSHAPSSVSPPSEPLLATSSRERGAQSVTARTTASTGAKRRGAVDLDAVRDSIGLHALPHTLLDEIGLGPGARPHHSVSRSRDAGRALPLPVAGIAPISASTTHAPAAAAATLTAGQDTSVPTPTTSPPSLHSPRAVDSATNTREAVRVLSERLQALACELAVLDERVSVDGATSHSPADLASTSASVPASALPALGNMYARVRESVFGPVGVRRNWGDLEATAYASLGARASTTHTSLTSQSEDDHIRGPRCEAYAHATSLYLPDAAAVRRPFTPRVVTLRPGVCEREDARAAVRAEKLLRRASQRTLRHDGIDDRIVVTNSPRGLVLATSRMERERVAREPIRTPQPSVLARRFYGPRPSSDLHVDVEVVATAEAREREDYRIRQATFGARVAVSHIRL